MSYDFIFKLNVLFFDYILMLTKHFDQDLHKYVYVIYLNFKLMN